MENLMINIVNKKFAFVLATCLATTTAYSMDRVAGGNLTFASGVFGENASRGTIHGFSGAIYQEGDSEYTSKIEQYATTSFPKDKMSPFMVAYPKDVGDIQVALNFARTANKKVVARSGGHQYCGKSSGGNDTIVLSMDNFATLKRLENGLAEVGPCVKLENLATQFKQWGITIPHGECPLVNIGGHLQTGGWGHLLHSFGLGLDYVHAFDIILADGTFKTVTRPTAEPQTTAEKQNLELFRGVLGGNAGSFGIITKYILTPIKDTDHPRSWGFSKERAYNKSLFRSLMQEVQGWTQKIEADIQTGQDIDSLKGLDFMMTVESSRGWPLPPILVVECVYSDLNGNVPYKNQFDSIVKKSKENQSWLDRGLSLILGFEGEKTLSALSDSFVRRFPRTTLNGHEFSDPYKKRVNVTMQALSDGFVDQFSTKIDEVVSNEPNVKLVFQMAFGGGALRAKGNEMIAGTTITSIPHRDMLYQFVFDLFYKPGYEQRAISLQEQMQTILDSYFHNDSHERRMFWGSFGDTNMQKLEVQKMYYDSPEQYERLQDLKHQVDPNDIFHTDMTVKLQEHHQNHYKHSV